MTRDRQYERYRPGVEVVSDLLLEAGAYAAILVLLGVLMSGCDPAGSSSDYRGWAEGACRKTAMESLGDSLGRCLAHRASGWVSGCPMAEERRIRAAIEHVARNGCAPLPATPDGGGQ